MQQQSSVFKLASSSLLLAGVLAAANVMAGQGTVDFTAVVNTSEFMLPVASCAPAPGLPGFGGIGAGTGTTNLFTNNPATDKTTIVMTSFDCVYPDVYQPPQVIKFASGRLTLTGAGGDTIFASYSGSLRVQGPGPLPGTMLYNFDKDGTLFSIEGGTGRYTRASGGGNISGTEITNFATGTSQGNLTATGKIIY